MNATTKTVTKRVLAAALLLLGAAGCNEDPIPKPITVDVFIHKGENLLETGDERPLQVAVNDINAAGGINGREMQVWLHDLAPAKAVLDAVALKDSGVRVLFTGPSDVTIPIVREVTIPSKVFVFATMATSPILTDELARPAGGYFARTSYTASTAAKKLARMVYDSGARKVGVLYAEDGIGPEYSNAFIAAFRDEGGEITGDPPAAQVIAAGALQASYKRELLEAAQGASLVQGKPAIMAIVSPDAFKVLLRDAAGSRLAVQWFGGHTMRAPGVLDEASSAEAAEGMLGVCPARGRALNADGSPGPYTAYEASFKKYFPEADAGANWFPHAYDAMVVYALAHARAGGGDPSADKIKTALRKVANAGIGKKPVNPGSLVEGFTVLKAGGDLDYQGASGSVDFSATGDVVGNWIEYRVAGGKFITEFDPDF